MPDLFNDSIGNAGQVTLLQIHQNHTRFQASTQIQQRMKGQRCNVRPTPTVRTLFDVLFVLDPARGFFPFPFFAGTLQFVQLNENLVRTMVEMFLWRQRWWNGRQRVAASSRLLLHFVTSQTAWIIGPVRLQPFLIGFLWCMWYRAIMKKCASKICKTKRTNPITDEQINTTNVCTHQIIIYWIYFIKFHFDKIEEISLYMYVRWLE